MRRLATALVLSVICVLSVPVFASVHAIPLAADRTQMTGSHDGADALEYQLTIGNLQAIDIQTKAGLFTRLLIPGFHTSHEPGQPELPMMNRLIAVPPGAEIKIEILNTESRVISLEEFGIRNRIMPAQPSLSKGQDPDTVPFLYDISAYEQPIAKAATELVCVTRQGRLRAMDIGRIEVSPVEYLPLSGEIRITDSIDFRVVFEPSGQSRQKEHAGATYSLFFEHLYAGIDGAGAFKDSYPDRTNDVVTMVIVSPPQFEAQLADFVRWKTERGFRTILAVTGTPEVGSTTDSIRDYLHGLYNDATDSQPAPSFVLLVGDVEQMPTFFESGSATDRPYCAVDNDLIPDMYYGRFSATNASELQAIIDKTMTYDRFTMPDPSYLDDVVLIAGMDSGYGATHGNGQINYGTTNYFNAAHGINSDTYLYPESGNNATDIIASVGQGSAYTNYTAHGTPTGWVDPAFTQADISTLGNIGQYGLTVGNCCESSTFDYGECFAETWLRAPNRGAVGYIGASNTTNWDEDFWWGVGHTTSISANPGFESTGQGAYDGLFLDTSDDQHLRYVTQDAIIFSGNLAVMEAGGQATYYWNIYNLMGDPSLSPYIGIPDANPVIHAEQIEIETAGLSISAAAGSYVGLTQSGVLIGAGTVFSANEPLVLDLEHVSLTSDAPVKLVVMAQNREPYITEIPVSVPVQATIQPRDMNANELTDFTVTVLEAGSLTPQPGVVIRVDDPFGNLVAPVETDINGKADFSFRYAYGTQLEVYGIDPVDNRTLFHDQITVHASEIINPDLSVTTAYGLNNVFAMSLLSTVSATAEHDGTSLAILLPDSSLRESTTGSLDITPTSGGQITAFIRLPGHDLYSETFPILTQGSTGGTIDLKDETENHGVLVTVTPGDLTTITDAAGNFLLTGLSPGSYTLTTSKIGWSTETLPITMTEGLHLTGLDFLMTPVPFAELCNAPALSIPDNTPAGVTDSLDIPLAGVVTSVEIALDLTHSYIGDLVVRLTSPEGTTVTLHNRSGNGSADLVGWYGEQLTPVGNLNSFLGEAMAGTWTLFVSDNADQDIGILNDWCLNIGFAQEADIFGNDLPQTLALGRNFPNPFNPQTTIAFDLPLTGQIELTIFDIRGLLVTTLIEDIMLAGHHTSTWYGKDSDGRDAASGVYFYRLAAMGQIRTGKMVLLR